MNRFMLLALAATALAGGCTSGRNGFNDNSTSEWGYYDRCAYDRYGAYDYDRPDPRYGRYEADRYFRNDRRYRERELSENDRIYRGRKGRYYCRRSDGTTGLIVVGIAGGLAGKLIAAGDSKTLGTVLGAIGGAAVGAAIDSGKANGPPRRALSRPGQAAPLRPAILLWQD